MRADEIVKELGDIEAMSESVGTVAAAKPDETKPEPTKEPEAAPAPEKAPEAPKGDDAAPKAEPEAKPAETPPTESEAKPEINVTTPIMPETGTILKEVAASLNLTLIGMHGSIVRANLQENAEQLGPLSLLMASIKKAKDQADALLGNGQQ